MFYVVYKLKNNNISNLKPSFHPGFHIGVHNSFIQYPNGQHKTRSLFYYVTFSVFHQLYYYISKYSYQSKANHVFLISFSRPEIVKYIIKAASRNLRGGEKLLQLMLVGRDISKVFFFHYSREVLKVEDSHKNATQLNK